MIKTVFSRTRVRLLLILLAASSSAQTFSVLHTFVNQNQRPIVPDGALAQGRDGALYGTTTEGGLGGSFGQGGVIYRFVPKSGDVTIIHEFQGQPDGATPQGGLLLGTDGNFYGVTEFGGANNFGTFYQVTPAGVVSVLYSFTNGSDGGNPSRLPTLANDGNFYGSTDGGAASYGTVWSISPTGTLDTVFAFDRFDGASPTAVTLGNDGELYGVTEEGFLDNDGDIFRVSTNGDFIALHNQPGRLPCAPLIQANDGNFYGGTGRGGSSGGGTAYQVTPTGVITTLHSFNITTDGYGVCQALVQGTDGNFYGVTVEGGVGSRFYGPGTLFEVTAVGSFTLLHTFGLSDGESPGSPLAQHTNGVFYGTTSNKGFPNGRGTIFSLNASLGPHISLVSVAGSVGSTIGILGQGLLNTTAVSFNGTAAQVTTLTDTYLEAIVPTGATNGFVTVTVAGGTLTSNREFQVLP